MDAHRSRLTRLYSSTRHSLEALPPPSINDLPEKQRLDRKYRNQRDRLIAWGLEWRDEFNGDIDQSVQQAGLGEVVEGVLENINSMLEEAERMNTTQDDAPSPYPVEKPGSSRAREWTTSDLSRYEDLVKDLTGAIDLLCEMSSHRRGEASQRGSKSGASKVVTGDEKDSPFFGDDKRSSSPVPAYRSVESSFEPQSATAPGPPQDMQYDLPKIDPNLLLLPREGPPNYGDSRSVMRGAASGPIVLGYMQHSGGVSVPIMVEYVNFDQIYRGTDIRLPMDRVEQLYAVLGSWDSKQSSSLSRPVAYFEDPDQPRYGLLYEQPPAVRGMEQQDLHQAIEGGAATLSRLLHDTSKRSRDTSNLNPLPPAPPLEERYRMAQELVQGFGFLQRHGFAHRNISSSSVALFLKSSDAQSQAYDIRHPRICAVDLFSEYDMDPPPEILQQNVYRHPDDPRITGSHNAYQYELRFDLYSLCLLLLEIGLWFPLAELYKQKYSLKDFKLRVQKIWIMKELPQKCGTLFTRCINDLFQASDDPTISMDPAKIRALFQKLQARMDRCCSIDAEEEDVEIAHPPDPPKATTDVMRATSAPLPAPAQYPSEKRQQSVPSGSLEKQSKRTTARNIYTDLHIPSHIQREYEAFEGRLLKIVSLALQNSQESSWVDLHYAGAVRETAKPTICVGCTNTKRVRSAIKKNLHYDSNLFELAVVKDTVTRSKSTASVRRSHGGSSESAKNREHHQRPLCGSSIGAWRYAEHSPAVTFGGIVLVDGEPFGMTVHHLLEDPEDDTPSAAQTQSTLPEMSDDESDEDSDSEDETIPTLDDTLSEPDDNENFSSGVIEGQGQEILLTQPALDDVPDDFFPNEEDRDEDHIDSHRLGHVHASSGLRRATHFARPSLPADSEDPISHEIDWLLMSLDAPRLQPFNVIPGGKQHCPDGHPCPDSLFTYRPKLLEPVCRSSYESGQDLYPRKVLPQSRLSGAAVHCTGRTSGLGTGKISQRMRWVRFQGRTSFSQVWSCSGSFGRAGDSGAWVIDNEAGCVAGHVLAYSEKFEIAYISPMEVMLEDMRAVLNAKSITLPGADQSLRPMSMGSTGVDLSHLVMGQLAIRDQNLRAMHCLQTGNPTRLEQEWAMRRERLGAAAIS